MRKPSEYARLLDAELARLDSPDAIGLALAHLRGTLFMERFSEELVVGKRRFVPWSEFPKALRRAAKITGTLEEQA